MGSAKNLTNDILTRAVPFEIQHDIVLSFTIFRNFYRVDIF